MGDHFSFLSSLGKLTPNIGLPLLDASRVTSSSITSQCSARSPSLMRTMSAAIQFTGWPKPENRPCTITKSPFGHHRPRLILQRWRHALDEFDQALAPRFNVSAVLNVVR